MRELTMLDDFKTLFGLPVEEAASWRTDGKELTVVKGTINHHTGGALHGDWPSAGVLLGGRPGLPPRLCNASLKRSAIAVVVTSGKANHGGKGRLRADPTADSNYEVLGLEVEHSGGPNEPIVPAQFENMCRIHAAWLRRHGLDANHCDQHREYALPHGRKPDFIEVVLEPFGGDQGFRNRIQDLIDHPPGLAQPVAPKPYKLDRIIKVGDRDTPGNQIVTRVEQLLLWNANKHGFPGHRPGKVDGKFTEVSADSVEAFRHWWWVNIDLPRPAAKRHFNGPKGREVGPKVLDALTWAALN